MAVAHDCMTEYLLIRSVFSAFSCGGFECHTEHFIDILSLNSLRNSHRDQEDRK